MSIWDKSWATSQRPSKAVFKEVKYSKTGWKPVLITIGIVLAVAIGVAVLLAAACLVSIYFFLKILRSLAPRVNKDAMWLYTPKINKDAMWLYTPRISKDAIKR